jgi:hypothetical protein
MLKKITRRGALLAGALPMLGRMRPPQARASGDPELLAARRRSQDGAARALRQVKLAPETEPAFLFRA